MTRTVTAFEHFQMDASFSSEWPGCGGRIQLRIHGPLTKDALDLMQSYIALIEKSVLHDAAAPSSKESGETVA